MINRKNAVRLTAMTAALALCSITHASSATPWKFEIAPYLWAINMNGHVQVGSHTASVNQSFSDIMKQFDGGGMLFINANKNKFGLFFDGVYSDLSNHKKAGPLNVHSKNTFGIFSGGASYRVYEKAFQQAGKFDIEPYFGARYTMNDTTISIDDTAISASKNVTWTDPILGTRFRYIMTKAWRAILGADIGGTGNRDYSYNLNGVIGYKPQTRMKWATFYLGYRYLYQYYGVGSGRDNFLWNMKLFGPVIGFSVTF